MKRKIVIVDVDGTMSNQDHRNHFLTKEPKDWDSYFNACDKDTPMPVIVDLVNRLSFEYDIFFCTGRTEDVRDKTEKWLSIEIGAKLFPSKLLMRKSGDFRHDKFIKPELLEEAGIKAEDVAFILEDRNTMVQEWRKLGFTCLQVAEGDF